MIHSDRQKSAFTLIEVLVVLLILTALVSVVGVNVLQHQSKAKWQTARIQMSEMVSALKIYKLEQNRYPTTDQGLEALVERPQLPPRPTSYPEEGYLDGNKIPLDPWGNPYIYLAPGRAGEAYEIITYGQDGEPGGIDDAADLSSSMF